MWNKILIIAGFLILPVVAMAAPADIYNPVTTGVDSIGGLFKVILNGITFLATPIIVLALIWVGFKFVSAQGDASKVSAAKTSLMVVLAGAAIILGANVI